jgi:ribosomal protein S6
VPHYEVVYLIHEDRVEEVENVVSKVQGVSLNTHHSDITCVLVELL